MQMVWTARRAARLAWRAREEQEALKGSAMAPRSRRSRRPISLLLSLQGLRARWRLHHLHPARVERRREWSACVQPEGRGQRQRTAREATATARQQPAQVTRDSAEGKRARNDCADRRFVSRECPPLRAPADTREACVRARHAGPPTIHLLRDAEEAFA